MNSATIIQHADLREIYELKKLIERYKKSQKRIPLSIRERTLDLLNGGQTARSLAKTLQLHESTLSKWRKKHQTQLDEKAAETLPEAILCKEGLSLKNKLEKVSPFTHEEVAESWKIQSALLFFFGLVFVLLEVFLIQQSTHYNNAVNGLSWNEALNLGLLTELVPVTLTMALYVLHFNWMEKFLVTLTLIASFIYSTYAVSGKSINRGLEKQHQYEQILNLERKQKEELKKANELIDYYKSRPQSNGSVGWPMTVMKYEEEKKGIQTKLEETMLAKQKLGSVKAENTKVIFDAILKLMFQFAVLVLIAQIVILAKKVVTNFSKRDWVWNA